MPEAALARMEQAVDNQLLNNRFADLSTPLLADAYLRLRLPLRVAPPGERLMKTYADAYVLVLTYRGVVYPGSVTILAT